jgi:PST family polysaccharide transporter
MGIGAGLIQAGANALTRHDVAMFSALRRSAWLMLGVVGVVSFLVLAALRTFISHAIVGDSAQAGNVVLLGVALLFNLAWTLETSILNAHHSVKALARVGLFKGLVGNLLGVVVVWIWHERAIALAITASCAANWMASRYFLSKELDRAKSDTAPAELAAAARSLLRFGVPFTASTLAGTGVQYVLPILVLHALGVESAGFYGAAAMIAVGYVGFFLGILAQDYYPRVSAARDHSAVLVNLINEQHRVLMMAGMPVVLGLLTLAGYVIRLVYSPHFVPAVEVLEWQLIGDLLRFSGWTMSFVVLARNGSVVFFVTELVAGLTLLAASWWGLRWFGLPGVGMAFLASAVVHNLVVSWVVRRDIGLTWTPENRIMILFGVSAALTIRLLAVSGFPVLRMVVALGCVTVASWNSLRLARAEWHGIGRNR